MASAAGEYFHLSGNSFGPSRILGGKGRSVRGKDMAKGHTHNGMPNPDDNLRIPEREGEPPRPATEPPGAEGSSEGGRTETDPATGAPLSRERRRVGNV
jgi:hypothetical protein